MRKAILLFFTLSVVWISIGHAQQGEEIVRKAYKSMLLRNAIEWNTIWKWKPLSEDDTVVLKGHAQFARLDGGRFILRTLRLDKDIESILVPDTLLSIYPEDSTVHIILKENWKEYNFIDVFVDDLAADVMTNLKYEQTNRADLSHHFALALKAYNDPDDDYEEIFNENNDQWDIQLNGETDTIRLIIRKQDHMITFGHHYLVLDGESQSYSYTFSDFNFAPRIPLIRQRLDELPDYYTTEIKHPQKPDSLDLGSPVEWKGRYFEGDTVSSEDFKGKYALYKFTYRSCGWCEKAIPWTNEIMERFPDIAVVGLDPYDTDKPEKLRQHIEKREIKYPIVFISYEDAKRLKVQGYPRFYLVNPEGKLIWRHAGYPSNREEEVMEELAEVMRKELK